MLGQKGMLVARAAPMAEKEALAEVTTTGWTRAKTTMMTSQLVVVNAALVSWKMTTIPTPDQPLPAGGQVFPATSPDRRCSRADRMLRAPAMAVKEIWRAFETETETS